MLQNKKTNKPAKGCTAAEFLDVLAAIKKAAVEQAKQHPQLRRYANDLFWSFDHATIHAVDLSKVGIPADMRMPLPKKSPDFHRVVERCLAQLSRCFKSRLVRTVVNKSIQYYRDLLRDTFVSCIKPAAVKKDVLGLPALYRFVATKAAGGWPPAYLR